MRFASIVWSLTVSVVLTSAARGAEPHKIDFNRDIRTLLSNNCFHCHGPDPEDRKGGGEAGLRLDTRDGAIEDLGGYAAVVPGEPDESEFIRRLESSDEDERMPPVGSGKKLSPQEIALFREWVKQGAPYAEHWAYVPPVRPETPAADPAFPAWSKNPVDRFLLDRLKREGLKPAPEADRYALARRAALDVTGLPPAWEEVERFVNDPAPDAYEQYVDRLLAKPTYGEHWARLWLDLARYADSAGYADDPERTIWGYRDYVIRAFNDNKPFDQFTLEQIAGDLLPNPTPDQLVATAFHRNTLTNNEGGTNDEEFRNVAVVDRVNTTFAVWMGTTMACAQCHTHKYDPITQEEYFRVFAILNNSADADRKDESPLIQVFTDQQLRDKAAWEMEIAALEKTLQTPTPEIVAGQAAWEQRLKANDAWKPLVPSQVQLKSGVSAAIAADGVVRTPRSEKTDVYTVELPFAAAQKIAALRIDALTDPQLPNGGPGWANGNFVISRIQAELNPPANQPLPARYVRIEVPGEQKVLSLAEVQVFHRGDNLALQGEAKQSSTAFNGPPQLAIDGNPEGAYLKGSVTHTAISDDPWWELDLKTSQPLDRVVLWNRGDGLGERLKEFRLLLLNEAREVVWERLVADAPDPSAEFPMLDGCTIELKNAQADFSQQGFDAAGVLITDKAKAPGWAIAPEQGKDHWLTIIPDAPLEAPAGARLRLTIEQLSQYANHTLGRFRISSTSDPAMVDQVRTPADIAAILQLAPEARSAAQKETLTKYFLSVSETLKPQRERLAKLKTDLAGLKPATTVPIMRELPQNRKTHIQLRGNWLNHGAEVTPGVPAAFGALPENVKADRLALARWLVDEKNPLTARVLANRYWETIFGTGLVASSEEFGSQGDLPSHPELLDWLATEMIAHRWDMKSFVRLLVTSAAYRQSSHVTPEQIERDPENRLLARGPRFRLSAEMIRDQALAVSGLLSPKLYGPPVKPYQPSLGLKAAFGGGTDWQTSAGEDRYRRGIYTTWRRSNPYPSMATFDAPNREVCTLKRSRTNTPLQALVTLNDPVYIEAAQALARRTVTAAADPAARARYAFVQSLGRPPREEELGPLVALYEQARSRFAANPALATPMATAPLGPAPPGQDVVDLAAWTVVGNVLLNLDEMFMRR